MVKRSCYIQGVWIDLSDGIEGSIDLLYPIDIGLGFINFSLPVSELFLDKSVLVQAQRLSRTHLQTTHLARRS